MSAGPGGGTRSQSGECRRNDEAVTSIIVRSGAFVDKIDYARCRDRDDGGWRPDKGTFSLKIGGSGGGECFVTCPFGEALYKVTVKSGGWIDSISGQCRQ